MGKEKYGVIDDGSTYAHGLTLKQAVRRARALRDDDDTEGDGPFRVVKHPDSLPSEEIVDVDLDDPVFMTRTELRERLGREKVGAIAAKSQIAAERQIAADLREKANDRDRALIEAGLIPVDVLRKHCSQMIEANEATGPIKYRAEFLLWPAQARDEPLLLAALKAIGERK